MTKTDKKHTLETYKEKKKEYVKNPTKESWIAFCDAKRDCMLLGIII